MTAAQIAAGGLAGTDVLLVPNGDAEAGAAALGTGAQALRGWVNGGGRYVGWRGGTELAAALGLTTAGAALRRLGARYAVRRSGRTASFVIANPRELSAEELPLARRIPGELERARVGVLAYTSP